MGGEKGSGGREKGGNKKRVKEIERDIGDGRIRKVRRENE